MSGEYNGFCRERKELRLDAAYEGKFVTTVEIAATAASCENDITWEKEWRYIVLSVDFARILAEEGKTARGMPSDVNHLQTDFCNFDDVAVIQVIAQSGG